MRRSDVFFWVQHLLGIGHLTRAAALVRAMRRAGLEVTLVSGGLPLAGLDLAGAELVQLEPVQSDGIDFKHLLDEEGRPIDDAFKARRAQALVEAYASRQPRLVLLEMFPFGRRQMRFELDPLLEAVARTTPRPALLSSVRDILVQAPKSGRLEEMLARAAAFDRILVHGDPGLIPFGQTFPAAAHLGHKLVHTGYVVEPPEAAKAAAEAAGGAAADGDGEIIVSTGGGRVGERLLEIALQASERLAGGPPWRLLVGQHLPEASFERLAARARAGVVVERARADFPALLGRAALSISQGGYNTVMEVLVANCPAIVVPYAGGLETEQTLRCRLLAERGLLCLLDEATLDGEVLAEAVSATLAAPPPFGRPPRLDGLAQTVGLLGDYLPTRNQREAG